MDLALKQMSPLLHLHDTIPPKEELERISPYRDEFLAIVNEIIKENPKIRTPSWNGKVTISQPLKKRITIFADKFAKDKRAVGADARREILDAIKSLAMGSERKKYQRKTEKILGLFEYLHQFAQNYTQHAADTSKSMAFRASYATLTNTKSKGPLTPKEGYLVYCNLAKHNPVYATHYQEIETAKGLKKAIIWTEIHAERQATAATTTKQAAALKRKPRP
ncbi:MAG: hypothetical protein NUV57_03165 [archaeon]|nr:hypothetical protein [archaeon]